MSSNENRANIEVGLLADSTDGTDRRLKKVLRPRDGVAVAFVAAAAGLTTIGPSITALGTWGAILLWGLSVVVGVSLTRIYAEMSAMFPEKSGGLALYANEGWRRYTTAVGPLATFGYWFGWSIALAVVGLVIGDLVQGQWFPGAHWTFWDGAVHIGLPQLIAAAAIVLVWLFNVLGVKSLLSSSYVLSLFLIVPVAVIIIASLFTGSWSAGRLHWGLTGTTGHGLTTALVWMYIMGWTAWGTEICASFAPEFRDTKKDTWTALKWAGTWTFGYYLLLPFAVGGVASVALINGNPYGFYGPLVSKLIGVGSSAIVVMLVGALLLVMNSSTADGGRALYGMSVDRLTLRQLGHLNRASVPARAMTVDLVVNLLLVFFVAKPISVLLAGNLGYVLAAFFSVTGFLLLRRDRPEWPRPIRLGRAWIGVAAVLATFLVVLIVLAALNPSITGYGSGSDLLIGVGILLLSLVLFWVRRRIQDGERIPWRDSRVEVAVAAESAE